jgi:hygromycin-B 7''-O-kinase
MSRLPGVLLNTVWDQTSAGDRDHLAGHLGETIAALHQMPPPPIDNWWPTDWPGFAARQRAQCVKEQGALGLASAWVEQLPGFLDDVALASGPLVLLHTEIMAQHLLVTQTAAGAWRLSGLFDFEPAMRGAREYEFAAVGIFVAHGEARVLRRMLTAYGYPSNQLGHALGRRLLAWAILHRYSNLASWMRRLPEPRFPTLDALAERWFAT